VSGGAGSRSGRCCSIEQWSSPEEWSGLESGAQHAAR
jgi:hypothetical protein